MPIVATVDQQSSRRQPDRVGAALSSLQPLPVLRPFERTAGDELQGVLNDGQQALHTVLRLIRLGGFHIGLGLGATEQPLPASTREGRGEAYERARRAVERAKRRSARLAVEGPDAARARDAQTALDVLAALCRRRSAAAWEAIDLIEQGLSTTAAAARLNITRQAVQQRLTSAQWPLELDVRELVVRLLDAAVPSSEADSEPEAHVKPEARVEADPPVRVEGR
ncbi:MAG: hypothetical protein ACTHNT_07075 [Actinomycetales bacterium]